MYLDKYLCKDRQFGGVYARDCLYKVKTLSGSAVLLFYLQFNWVMREIFFSPLSALFVQFGKMAFDELHERTFVEPEPPCQRFHTFVCCGV